MVNLLHPEGKGQPNSRSGAYNEATAPCCKALFGAGNPLTLVVHVAWIGVNTSIFGYLQRLVIWVGIHSLTSVAALERILTFSVSNLRGYDHITVDVATIR